MASSRTLNESSFLNIVLVGKTGSGKSSTGNSIIGRKEFSTYLQTTPGTDNCQLESGMYENVILNVIDTPGLMSTGKTKDNSVGKLHEIMSLCPGGFHAFIFVFNCNARFTKDDLDTIEQIKIFFGEEFIKCCIIAFTHGDTFEMDDNALPFDDWLNQQTGEMAKLIQDCTNRCLLFYNSTKYPLYEQKRQETVSKLIQIIQEQNMFYDNEKFKLAETGRREIIRKNKLPQLDVKYQQQLSLIIAELEKAAKNKTETESHLIYFIEQKINTLRETIENDGNDTKALRKFKARVETLAHAQKSLRSEYNADILKKMAEYTRLLKNPPNDIVFAIQILTHIPLAIVGVVATVTTAFIPPVAAAIGAGTVVLHVANSAMAYKTWASNREYKTKLKALTDELIELKENEIID